MTKEWNIETIFECSRMWKTISEKLSFRIDIAGCYTILFLFFHFPYIYLFPQCFDY